MSNEGRPLTARSVIASTLLGTHPPRLPVALLVRSCELFGIKENAARVALSRMVAAAELDVADGWYCLLGKLRQRQDRQMQSRRGRSEESPWDGTWLMVVVGAQARSATERATLRGALRHLRFAEWREGLWLRPDTLSTADRTDIEFPLCTLVPGARPPDAKGLARFLFSVDEWVVTANELLGDLDALSRLLTTDDATALTDGFVKNAAVLRHLQADPLLPRELLPRSWPGARLRTRYERFDEVFLSIWQEHLHR